MRKKNIIKTLIPERQFCWLWMWVSCVSNFIARSWLLIVEQCNTITRSCQNGWKSKSTNCRPADNTFWFEKTKKHKIKKLLIHQNSITVYLICSDFYCLPIVVMDAHCSYFLLFMAYNYINRFTKSVKL